MDLTPACGADLIELGSAHLGVRALQTAIRLGLFEALTGGPLEAGPLGARIGAEPGATQLLADTMVGLGLLTPGPTGYANAALATRHLTSDGDEPLTAILGYWTWAWTVADRLPAFMASGQPVRATGMFEGDPAAKETFIRAMHDTSRSNAPLVVGQFDLDGPARLIDLGAGPGTYALALLERHPQLRATLLDLPGSLAVAEKIVAESGLSERVELLAGDFLADPLGGPYDAALASHVVHGIDEAAVPRLLSRISEALAPGGQLLLQDFFLEPDRGRPSYGSLFGLYMRMQNPGARCFSFQELADWLEAAGFCRVRWITGLQPRGLSMIKATKR